MAGNWYPHYPGDYARKTGHLSLLEHGAYRILLDHYYATETPLPTDVERTLRLCRATSASEHDAVLSVLKEFFVETPEGWRHERADEEIEKSREKRGKCSAAGQKSAAQRQRSSNGRSTDVVTERPTEGQPLQPPPELDRKKNLPEPAAPVADQTLPSKPKSVKQPQAPKGETRKAYPADFEEFWAGYPTDANMGKAEALVPWLKLDAEERKQAIAALTGFRDYCRQNQNWYRPAHAVKFLKARRFEQYAAVSAEKAQSAEEHDASLQATFAAWNGSAEKLCGRIGGKAFGQWFSGSQIVQGPPAKILVAKQFQRDQILSKFGALLAETFGDDVRVEVAA